MMLEVNQVSIDLDNLTGNNVITPVLKAPAAENGGGITLLSATYFAGAATTAGTAHSLQLLIYSSTGSLAGTASSVLGGTANPFSANSFNAFTITDKSLEAGQYLVVEKKETNTSAPTRSKLIVEYTHAVS